MTAAAGRTAPRAPLGRVLMIQGMGSHVGKSTVTAAFCRLFARAGYRVAPFKAQNMSNNAAVTDDGREVGRAQAAQALAAGVPVTADMNPILLKPQSDRSSQVVVLGRPWRTADAREYYDCVPELWPVVAGALDRLRASYDIVVAEGAGSPAEINLAEYDIVNMRVARHADAPVLLVGDIERGGMFASLYGTVALLAPEERARVRGFIVNKFRGDPSFLGSGFEMLRERTGVPTLGVLPYMDLSHVPAEDAVDFDARGSTLGDALLDVVVLRLPRVAHLDEFQALAREPGVRVRLVAHTGELGAPDLVIIPGTKSTMADLGWLRARGLDAAVVQLRGAGTPVLGICGGYQMLGARLLDPHRVEGDVAEVPGLGLLPVVTTFAPEKITERVTARVAAASALWASEELPGRGAALDAYEIHMGRTTMEPTTGGAELPSPFAVHAGACARADGAVSADGVVVGTYLHGLLENQPLRRTLVARLAARKGVCLPEAGAVSASRDAFDDLAHALCEHVDLGAVAAMLDLPPLCCTG